MRVHDVQKLLDISAKGNLEDGLMEPVLSLAPETATETTADGETGAADGETGTAEEREQARLYRRVLSLGVAQLARRDPEVVAYRAEHPIIIIDDETELEWTVEEDDALDALAARLAARYRWQPAAARAFLIEDMVPEVLALLIEFEPGAVPALDTFTLRVDASMPPRQMAYWYGAARAAMRESRQLRGRYRSLTVKHLTLAAYGMTLEQRGDRRKVMERMREWNMRHPAWTYRSVNHFAGDYKKAMLRLRGELAARAVLRPTLTKQAWAL